MALGTKRRAAGAFGAFCLAAMGFSACSSASSSPTTTSTTALHDEGVGLAGAKATLVMSARSSIGYYPQDWCKPWGYTNVAGTFINHLSYPVTVAWGDDPAYPRYTLQSGQGINGTDNLQDVVM